MRREAVLKDGKIKESIKDLEAERELLSLYSEINTKLMKTKKKFGRAKKTLVLGQKEIKLLYRVNDSDIPSEFKPVFNDRGFIEGIWGMKLFVTNRVESIVEVVVAADSVALSMTISGEI
jgi:hypothetical protein